VVLGEAFRQCDLPKKVILFSSLKKGKRFADKDFAKSNWQFWKYVWMPAIRAHGIMQISILKGVMVLHGAAVAVEA